MGDSIAISIINALQLLVVTLWSEERILRTTKEQVTFLCRNSRTDDANCRCHEHTRRLFSKRSVRTKTSPTIPSEFLTSSRTIARVSFLHLLHDDITVVTGDLPAQTLSTDSFGLLRVRTSNRKRNAILATHAQTTDRLDMRGVNVNRSSRRGASVQRESKSRQTKRHKTVITVESRESVGISK